MIVKSRDIPINELFYFLQLEWISYYVRSRIYERSCDIKKFNDICRMKKEKIDTFSLRNSIASIFSKEEKMKKYFDLFYPFESTPQFQYTPNTKGLLYWDKFYFYKKGVEVSYREKVVKIVKNNIKYERVRVEDFAGQNEVSYNEVRRNISYKIVF